MSVHCGAESHISRVAVGGMVLALLAWLPTAAEEPATFYRAFNLNGPQLTIDGHRWEAGDAPELFLEGLAAFENQSVPLTPASDEARARMIRSSRWSPSGKATLRVNNLSPGTYSVYLYVWEDNDSQTFDIQLAGKVVAKAYHSGKSGQWNRLGPWVVDVSDGQLELLALGGHANLSGIELWRGAVSDQDHPLPDSSSAASPEAEVALLFARHCLECHNASERRGGLDLTQRAAALAGGESGEVLRPGDPDHSQLVNLVERGEMPPAPRASLSDGERKLVRGWVQSGARWQLDPIDPFLYTSDRRAGYNWWSLQPLRVARAAGHAQSVENRPPPEEPLLHPIDRYVQQRLEKAGFKPSPEADRRTLIRRLTFDLTGLPPTPQEVTAFLADSSPKAYDTLVDRLLDSPHYGERWARHWLDIVRFGESQGFERNKLRPNVWKYRDFVIEAFNSDMPYDEFIRWQIAGDVLQPENPLAVVASGFLAIGPYDLTAYNNGTPEMRAFAREEELEGLVGSVGQTFLGLTINCSRCHDHKFDPITQREFYQISAALGGTYQGDERECVPESAKSALAQRLATLNAEIAELRSREERTDDPSRMLLAAKRSRLESLVRLFQGGPVHTTVPKQPGSWRILARGDFKLPGEIVEPRGIAAIQGVSADWGLPHDAPEAERRKKLADWLAHPDNPLTARVIVNRLWGYHFGVGLVPTPSDFGFQGGLPSHPELLDWLATQLVHPSDGPAWSLKRIQRLIVTSSTYRQSSRNDPDAESQDADNRLLWKRSAQRLEAESFRDAVLAVAGCLDRKLGGPGFQDFKVSSAGNNETYAVFDAIGPDFERRSIYRTCVRSGTSPLLDTLDCPDPSVPTPRRSVTSTPLQALSLLNDAFIDHYAGRFAERLRRDAGENVEQQIDLAYQLAFARPPTTDEAAFSRQFIQQYGLQQLCVVLFNCSEFLHID